MPTRQEGVLQPPAGVNKPIPWILDLPDASSDVEQPVAVLLAHGAGGDASSGYLPAVAFACAASGLPCLRFTVRGSSLQHRIKVAKALLAAAPSLPGLQHVERWVVAGHSMGARLAASLAGEQPAAAPVAACLLLSYPLHPPGKPEELRDALLHQLHVPTLLVRGDRDPFSSQHQWDAALQGMPPDCAWRQHTVEGGDHGLKVGGKDGAARTAAAQRAMCAAVQQFVREAALAGQGQEQQRQQQQQQQQQQGRRQDGATKGPTEQDRGTSASSSRGRSARGAAATAQAGKKRSGVPAGADAASKPKKKAGQRQRRS